MTRNKTFFKALQKLTLALAIYSAFIQCSEDEPLRVIRGNIPVNPGGSNVSDSTGASIECKECTYIVPADAKIIDGKELGLKPGGIIGLSSAISYGSLEFRNIVGTKEQPIIIRNCGGKAFIKATDHWHALKTVNSKYFRITGGVNPGAYGIRVEGGEMGLKLDGLSTNFEVDHVEVYNADFAGIMAKTDPSCDDATIRGNFTMYDVLLHDNYIHETGGEGFYVGNSFYDGMERDCGIRLPHEIKGLKIYNNVITNAGWEAIQVGCAIEGTEIFNNTITNYGTVNKQFQNNGIQIGTGTGGLIYNNLIKKGTGNGMIILGTGDNVIYNNIIVDAGANGIFCDERFTPGDGFKFLNNTILSPKMDGIRLYAELVPLNTIVNNIIANPGSYSSYSGDRTSNDAFVFLESAAVKVKISNNLFVDGLEKVSFVDPEKDNYRLKSNSPAINYGQDISAFDIKVDFYQAKRLSGSAYDVGASEY